MISGGSTSEWRAPAALALGARSVHVWRVSLSRGNREEFVRLLSPDEQERARRFIHERDAHAYIVAHGTLRRVLAGYQSTAAASLRFVAGAFGKPSLVESPHAPSLEFNLSHSGDLALIAVSRCGPVGVDVEQWDRRVEHLELAEQFFSPIERAALRALAHDVEERTEGFFNAWTRKEAYLKATGHGITRGLHHFDVSLAPREPAALLADRFDPSAPDRWRMMALLPGASYSGAVVVTRAITEILLYDSV